MKLLFTLVLSLSSICIYSQVPYLVKDINEGSYPSNVRPKIKHNGILYFSAMDPFAGIEPFVTDGTNEGTQLLKDIDPNNLGSNPENFIVFNNEVFFTANNDISKGLWKTDGTTAGTELVKMFGNNWPSNILTD